MKLINNGLQTGVFRIMPNIYEELFAKTVIELLFSLRLPSFDRVLNMVMRQKRLGGIGGEHCQGLSTMLVADTL